MAFAGGRDVSDAVLFGPGVCAGIVGPDVAEPAFAVCAAETVGN